MKTKLIVVLAAGMLSGSAYAQSNSPGPPRNMSADFSQRIDFGVDFSMTQRPLDPRGEASAPGDSRRAGRADRPVDKPVEAGIHNAHVSRAGDAPVQGKPRRWPD